MLNFNDSSCKLKLLNPIQSMHLHKISRIRSSLLFLGSTANISTPSIYVPKTIINFKIHRELFEIQEKFAEAVEYTIEYYLKSTYDTPRLIDYITTHISTLLGPHENTPDKAQAVRKEFKEIKTLKDFFGLLQDKYTSWFKHEPITKLVTKCDYDENPLDENFVGTPVEWTWYKDRLHKYFEKCVTVADPASYGITNAPPGEQILIVKVDRGDYNQNDLYFLRQAIPPKLDRPDLKLYLCQVLSN